MQKSLWENMSFGIGNYPLLLIKMNESGAFQRWQ